ncbi:MAG: hypothetical protein Fur005_18960 [Roseiflexaceae bacterium]
MSTALEPLHHAIHTHVLRQPSMHMDETRWREQNRGAWLWVQTTPTATCFHIHRSRGRVAFDAIVPEDARGVIHSDRYVVYHHLPNARRQLCWAHLIRDLRACMLGTDAAQRWATSVLRQVQHLFALWQWYRRALIDQIQLQVLLAPVRAAVIDLLQQTKLDDQAAEALRADLLRHWDALWTFSLVEGVEPTGYPLGERGGTGHSPGGAVAEDQFRHPEHCGKSLCRAAALRRNHLPSARAGRIRDPSCRHPGILAESASARSFRYPLNAY